MALSNNVTAVTALVFSSVNLTTLLVALTVFLLLLSLLTSYRQNRLLPPGPRGVPVMGVLPKLGKKPYLTIQRWWNQYGDIFSCYMGSRLVVVINGMDAMKECFIRQGDLFTGRPWNYFKKLTKNTGVVFTDGEVWKEHRRFTLSCLRDFGMGKVSLEEKIQEEGRYLLAELAAENGKPFDVRSHLPKAVSNIICSIVFGSRFDYSDEVFKANIEALDQSVRGQSLLGMIQFLPFLEFLPKVLPKDKLLMKNVQMRDNYAKQQLQHHLETLDHDNPRDFIDAYLIRMTQLKRRGEPTSMEEAQLSRTIQDLFIAGTETVNTTLKWSLLFMILHSDIQTKVQEEIDRVIGDRMPTMRDRQNMPYTEATIMECQRLGNIALFSVPRCTLEDVKVNGYVIPKGTWIFVNRWGVHASAKYWKNPRRFDPTRFMDKDGHVFKPDAFVPFGVGPRSCMGEGLAKMELFLFFTVLLQNFRFRLPDGLPVPTLEPKAGINMCPHPYLICADHR